MKATIKNLSKALELTAKAHQSTIKAYYEEDTEGNKYIEEITISPAYSPVVSDVTMIAKAFGISDYDVTTSSFTESISVFPCIENENAEVDIELLSMALPNGWVNKINGSITKFEFEQYEDATQIVCQYCIYNNNNICNKCPVRHTIEAHTKTLQD